MRRTIPCALLLGVLGVLPLTAGCADERQPANASAEGTQSTGAASSADEAPTQLVRADFDVEGMDCGGCVIGTRAALKKLPGVEQADASYDEATGEGGAWALYDPNRVTPERMMESIRELGYTPTLLEE